MAKDAAGASDLRGKLDELRRKVEELELTATALEFESETPSLETVDFGAQEQENINQGDSKGKGKAVPDDSTMPSSMTSVTDDVLSIDSVSSSSIPCPLTSQVPCNCSCQCAGVTAAQESTVMHDYLLELADRLASMIASLCAANPTAVTDAVPPAVGPSATANITTAASATAAATSVEDGAMRGLYSNSLPPADRWYYVVRGRQVGVFRGWNVVGPLVIRVPGAVYARGRTYAAALRLFEQSQARGDVEVVLE